MGKKRKAVEPKQNTSFKDLVSKSNLEALKPYINEQLSGLYQFVTKNAESMNKTLELAFLRIESLEGIVLEKLGYTEEDLNNKVVTLQNKLENLEAVMDEVKEGDTIRFEFQSRELKEGSEFSEASRQRLDKVAVSPYTYGPEIELPLLGMTPNQAKEIEFAKDDLGNNTMIARITINHIARPINNK